MVSLVEVPFQTQLCLVVAGTGAVANFATWGLPHLSFHKNWWISGMPNFSQLEIHHEIRVASNGVPCPR